MGLNNHQKTAQNFDLGCCFNLKIMPPTNEAAPGGLAVQKHPPGGLRFGQRLKDGVGGWLITVKKSRRVHWLFAREL